MKKEVGKMANYSGKEVTKKILADSLKKLMAKKALDKISIREVTEDCGLNRQTFYYHFKDIYDLLEWLYKKEAIALFENHKGVLLWQEGLLQFFKYIQENKEMCLCTLKSLGHNYLFKFFYDDVHRIFKNTINTLSDELDISEKNKELMTKVYVSSFASIVESWLHGNITETPEELISFIDLMLNDQMRGGAFRVGVSSLCNDEILESTKQANKLQ